MPLKPSSSTVNVSVAASKPLITPMLLFTSGRAENPEIFTRLFSSVCDEVEGGGADGATPLKVAKPLLLEDE